MKKRGFTIIELLIVILIITLLISILTPAFKRTQELLIEIPRAADDSPTGP